MKRREFVKVTAATGVAFGVGGYSFPFKQLQQVVQVGNPLDSELANAQLVNNPKLMPGDGEPI